MNRLVGVLLILLIIALASTASLGYLLTTSRPETTTTTIDTIVTTTVVSSATTLTNVYITNTITSTQLTNVLISSTIYPVFYVTEVVVVQPEVVNGICILGITNTTVHSTYNLPSQGMNETNAIGIVTTSTIYQNYTTPTIYENATIISNGTTTCLEINPYYNVTNTNCGICA